PVFGSAARVTPAVRRSGAFAYAEAPRRIPSFVGEAGNSAQRRDPRTPAPRPLAPATALAPAAAKPAGRQRLPRPQRSQSRRRRRLAHSSNRANTPHRAPAVSQPT